MINCNECNKQFHCIMSHIKTKHNLSCMEYLEKYPNAPLMSEEQKQKISINTKNAMKRPEVLEKYQKHLNTYDFKKNKGPTFDRNNQAIREKQYSQERNKKISEARKKYWEGKKGKTVEELYGEEKGQNIRRIKSLQNKGENNPAYGKIYKKIGRKRGYYKNFLFRSLWEYSFLKYLETQNISLKNIEYESILIKYSKNNGGRTYRPDFFLKEQRRLIEIKSKWYLSRDHELINIKKEAAEKWCLENNATFEILTEDDFPIISYKQAKLDLDVKFI